MAPRKKTKSAKSARTTTKSPKKRASAPVKSAATKSKPVASKAKPKTKVRQRRSVKAKKPRTRLAVSDKGGALTMKEGSLTVSLSPETHPEIFQIDALAKHVGTVVKKLSRSKKMRDFREFLVETEKSLQIILSNHLEDALRKYLK